ncbi:unnamed protein product [Effrenium voratum]|nr:unnamed protein product [Effrenium voratum]
MAPQFHALRHWICGDDLNFVRSLHKCRPASLKGGKTKALFHISHDERLVLKSLQGKELEHVKQEAASMFWYFDKVLFDKWPSVLTQVLGLFTVTATNKRGQTNTGWYIVQQNIRFSLRSTPHHVFDLKGVGIGRRVPTAVEEEETPAPPPARPPLLRWPLPRPWLRPGRGRPRRRRRRPRGTRARWTGPARRGRARTRSSGIRTSGNGPRGSRFAWCPRTSGTWRRRCSTTRGSCRL